MIPTKTRENRKLKTIKLPKNLERKYKESKCQDCSVVVTPMDFAKILGKFTKVKIQYESTSKPKSKHTNVVTTSSRLKAKENGMVDIHRQAYNLHPAQKLLGPRKAKPESPTLSSNVLKENNRLKKSERTTKSQYATKQTTQTPIKSKVKYYGVVFDNPKTCLNVNQSKVSLQELVTDINKSILPGKDWCIDYFPKNGEPKDDKIYDKIAAELEDLMYNEKTKNSNNIEEDSKNDEFPSILDILNENSKESPIKTNPPNSVNLESSDVEAMLLGNTTPSDPVPMEVDASQPTTEPEEDAKIDVASLDENPASPSILVKPEHKDDLVSEDKALEEGEKKDVKTDSSVTETNQTDENSNTNSDNKNSSCKSEVTQIIFKKSADGACLKSVICPKDMKYSISLFGKSVQLLGAPQHITSLEDLRVLLEIVEESDLTNPYVMH